MSKSLFIELYQKAMSQGYYSSYNDHLAKLLIKHNHQVASNDLFFLSQNRDLAIRSAYEYNWPEVIDYVLDTKDDQAEVNLDYAEILKFAYCYNNLYRVEELVAKCHDYYNITFTYASKKEDLNLIELLLSRVDLIDEKMIQAGFDGACEIGNESLVDYFLDYAKQNKYKISLERGLHSAFKGKQKEIILYLIIQGADIDTLYRCNEQKERDKYACGNTDMPISTINPFLDENDITYLYAEGVMFYGKYTPLMEKYIVWLCELPKLLDTEVIPVINSVIMEYL